MEDISSDTIECDLNHNEFAMDLHDLMGEDPGSSSESLSPLALSMDGASPVLSPLKKLNHHQPLSMPGNLHSTPVLSPLIQSSNNITNELFQVTSNLKKLHQREQQISLDDDDFIPIKRLANDKIEKMVNDLAMGAEGASFDYELDDQLRSRFYKGRFNNKHQFNVDTTGELDNQLHNYLNSNENKENLTYPDPLKIQKHDNSIKKSKRQVFKPSRRILSSTNINNNKKSSIPVLQPLPNVVNLSKPEATNTPHTSPNRICIPKHRSSRPGKPSIKYTDKKTNIFVVDSLTGLVNDATVFGTELNASNCDDFPLPENVNEIVQIPTNDDCKKKSKMAIIKVLHNKYFNEDNNSNKCNGFYNQKQFKTYQETPKTGVEVIGQSINLQSTATSAKVKAAVHWPDNLEW